MQKVVVFVSLEHNKRTDAISFVPEHNHCTDTFECPIKIFWIKLFLRTDGLQPKARNIFTLYTQQHMIGR